MGGKLVIFEDLLTQNPGLFVGLEGLGVECIRVRSGREVLPKIQEHNPPAVVLDPFMPQMSGVELLRQIKEADPPIPVKVVLIASTDSQAIAQRAADAGCDLYVQREAAEGKVLEFLRPMFESGGGVPLDAHSAQAGDDLRRAPRFEASGALTFTYTGGEGRGELINASSSGVLFAAADPVPVGSNLNIDVEGTGGDSLKVYATVVRTAILKEPRASLRHGIGAKFDEKQPAGRESLEALVEFKKHIPPKIEPAAMQEILRKSEADFSRFVSGAEDPLRMRTYAGALAAHEDLAFKSSDPTAGYLQKMVLFRAKATAFQIFIPVLDDDRKTLAPIFLPTLRDFLGIVDSVEDELDGFVKLAEGKDETRRSLNETCNKLHEAKLRLLFTACAYVGHEGLLPSDKAIVEAFKKKADEIRAFEKVSPEILRLERRPQQKPEAPKKEDKKKKKRFEEKTGFRNPFVQIGVTVLCVAVTAASIWAHLASRVPLDTFKTDFKIESAVVRDEVLMVTVPSGDWKKLETKKRDEVLASVAEYMDKGRIKQATIVNDSGKRVAAITSANDGTKKRAYRNRIFQ